MKQSKVTEGPKGRPVRNSNRHRDRLAVYDKDPNFEYRWVDPASPGGGVEWYQSLGYELVPNGTHKIASRASEGTALGSDTAISGGDGRRLVLMRINKDEYEAAQADKQAENQRQLKELQKLPDGLHGRITT